MGIIRSSLEDQKLTHAFIANMRALAPNDCVLFHQKSIAILAKCRNELAVRVTNCPKPCPFHVICESTFERRMSLKLRPNERKAPRVFM